jgi:phosphotransferase system HPr (HPr) family protein
MISKDYLILSPDGIHARPATALLKLARQFKSVVHVAKNQKTVRLNSMLNLLALSPKFGETITVSVDGEDEQEALDAIGLFFTEHLKDI